MKNWMWLVMGLVVVGGACSDDEVEADKVGVAAACSVNEDCLQEGQVCLEQFKGGYCGVEGCSSSADCPDGSLCVAHEDGVNYCFRACVDKVDCNRNRPADAEANCSSSVEFASGDKEGKACVPPSN